MISCWRIWFVTSGAIVVLTLGQAHAASGIKIGVAGPLTGDQGAIGEQGKNGAIIAVEEWNAKGGVLAKKIQISWGSTNPQFTERGLWNVFRTIGRDDQQGSVAADFIVKKLKKTKVVVLHDKTTYGQGIADETVKALEKAKITPVYYAGITQGDKDYRPVLTAVRQKNPEVLFYGGIYPEAILLSKQMRELGMKAVFVSGDGVWQQEYIDIAGKAAEGAFITFTPDQTKIKEAQGVSEKPKEKFGSEVGALTVYSYVAANILIEAIAATKSTDGLKLAEHIRKTKWNTALGPIQFDTKGDVLVSPFVVWEVKAGKFVEVR